MNNYVRTTAHLKNHTKLATTSMQFPDKENGIIYTYEAQYNPSTPLQKFMQSAKVCNNRVYLITLGLGPQAQ
jgi:hypothetical protein